MANLLALAQELCLDAAIERQRHDIEVQLAELRASHDDFIFGRGQAVSVCVKPPSPGATRISSYVEALAATAGSPNSPPPPGAGLASATMQNPRAQSSRGADALSAPVNSHVMHVFPRKTHEE
jgi:hypothetical protein